MSASAHKTTHDPALDIERLRAAASLAAGELTVAHSRLDAVMQDVSDLAPALKTSLCVALEGAVNEVRAAENHLREALSQVERHEDP